MHTINLANAKVFFEEIKSKEIKRRNSLLKKIPTITFPFLETKEGNISQSSAIEYYICKKYKPELLGNTIFQRAKINQWIHYIRTEVNEKFYNLIYQNNNEFKNDISFEQYKILNLIENELAKNEFISGKEISLADIILIDI